MAERAPDLTVIEVVDETLLVDARAHGVDHRVRGRLQQHLAELQAASPGVVVCTCSTLAGAVEDMSEAIGVPVVRIDRPMAKRAASIGGRIAVVVALESTLPPTMELLEECIAAGPSDGVLIEAPCTEAWAHFESGDVETYVTRLVDHAHDLANGADVIVLAQASMNAAADRLADLEIPVLCSPSAAVEKAVELARGAPSD